MTGRARIALALAATLSLIFAAIALAAEGQLTFVSCLKDTGTASSCSDAAGTVDGLDGASSVSTSPDGGNVYVASSTDKALAVFSRNPTTGALGYVEMQKDESVESTASTVPLASAPRPTAKTCTSHPRARTL